MYNIALLYGSSLEYVPEKYKTYEILLVYFKKKLSSYIALFYINFIKK